MIQRRPGVQAPVFGVLTVLVAVAGCVTRFIAPGAG
jgi:hypothetical protein